MAGMTRGRKAVIFAATLLVLLVGGRLALPDMVQRNANHRLVRRAVAAGAGRHQQQGGHGGQSK